MNLNIAGFILDFLIVGLLMMTISYCWILNRRIKILQDGKSELANLLQHFDESTIRASESIVALQSASKKIGENIQLRIDKANYLMDDLAFMVEKGNRLADQLDANFAVSRARSRVLTEDKILEASEGGYEIEKSAMKSSPTIEPEIASKAADKVSIKEKTAASLEAVLDRVIGRSKASNSSISSANGNVVGENDSPKSSKSASNARSKAERELLDMIRAGIKG
jgi:hypothetical protein